MKRQEKVTNQRASEYAISKVSLSLSSQKVNSSKMSQSMGMLWSAGN
jgi:hypothetical protein